jgi:galactonate dehydratase
MLIEDVRVVLVAAGGGFKGGTNCMVQIQTDTGIVGTGQSGTWAYPEAVAAVVAAFRTYLIGQDPLRIEHHWQHLNRMGPFRGNILHGAVSAVDIALWDIKGKHYDAPVWDLLGGRCRDKVRLHKLVLGDEHDPEYVSRFVRDGVAEGFTAIKFDPLPRSCGDVPLPELVIKIRDVVAAAREAAGPGVDLLLEFGRKLTPLQAPTVMAAVAEFQPLLIEDPTQIDSIQTQSLVASKTTAPIANGERLTSIWEFRELLEHGGPQFVRPDLGMGGGITHCKKIAAVAESYSSVFLSHNWLGPLLTAAAIHIDVSIPNFVVQEYSVDDETAPENAVFRSSLRREGGYMLIPDAPGLGVEFLPEVAATFPAVPIDWGADIDRFRRTDGAVHASF